MKNILIFIIFYFLPSLSFSGDRTIYISVGGSGNGNINSPFGSVKSAIDDIINKGDSIDGNLNLILFGGEYIIDETIIINSDLTNLVKGTTFIQNFDDDEVILSGKEPLDNWEHVGLNTFRTQYSGPPTKLLYIDGIRATFAREPNNCNYYSGIKWHRKEGAMSFSMPYEDYLREVEDFYAYIEFDWNNFYVHATDRIRVSDTIMYKIKEEQANQIFSLNKLPSFKKIHFEGSLDFLDSDKEWCIHDNYIYLKLFKKNPNECIISIPSIESFFKLEGKEGQFIKNVTIQGIKFEYTNWKYPFTNGYLGFQAGIIKPYSANMNVGSAISINSGRNISILNNIFDKIGYNAISLSNSNEMVLIQGNLIQNIGGSGIVVDSNPSFSSKEYSRINRNIFIDNNLIANIGMDFPGCVAIFGGYSDSMVVSNSEIFDIPYTGISIGWGWTANETFLKSNIIRNNHIYNCMQKMNDGAAIYTLSNQPGTIIQNNLVRNISNDNKPQKRFPIYLDEGSKNIVVKNNFYQSVENPQVFLNTNEVNKVETIQKYSLSGYENFGVTSKYIHLKNLNELDYIECGNTLEYETIRLQLYPNPFIDNKVNLSWDFVNDEILHFLMYSKSGELIHFTEFKNKQRFGQTSMNLQNLESGIYLVKIITTKQVIVRKLIKS